MVGAVWVKDVQEHLLHGGVLEDVSEVGLELGLPDLGVNVLQLALDLGFGGEVVDPEDIGVGRELVPLRSGWDM